MRASARSTSRSWAARCRRPRRSLPVARWWRSAGISLTQKPAVSASIVSEVSTPQPGARGWQASQVSRVMQRVPDSGCVASQPVARRMPRRAVRTTTPIPPAPDCGGSSAIAMSTPSPRTASTSGCAAAALSPMSASRNSRARGSEARSSITGSGPVWPGERGSACSSSEKSSPPSARSAPSWIATICAPVAIAAALPRLVLCRTTRASAPIATAEVASDEPSSTTTTRSTPGIPRADAMVASIRSASFLAGITTATRSGRCAVSGPAALIAASPDGRRCRPGRDAPSR